MMNTMKAFGFKAFEHLYSHLTFMGYILNAFCKFLIVYSELYKLHHSSHLVKCTVLAFRVLQPTTPHKRTRQNKQKLLL